MAVFLLFLGRKGSKPPFFEKKGTKNFNIWLLLLIGAGSKKKCFLASLFKERRRVLKRAQNRPFLKKGTKNFNIWLLLLIGAGSKKKCFLAPFFKKEKAFQRKAQNRPFLKKRAQKTLIFGCCF